MITRRRHTGTSPAQRGAALLDEVRPGWRENLTRPVNVTSIRDCPLGQLYGSYGEGMVTLRNRHHREDAHFSDSCGFTTDRSWYKSAGALNREWAGIISGRRSLWQRLAGRAA
jgi:hypothetical protein